MALRGSSQPKPLCGNLCCELVLAGVRVHYLCSSLVLQHNTLALKALLHPQAEESSHLGDLLIHHGSFSKCIMLLPQIPVPKRPIPYLLPLGNKVQRSIHCNTALRGENQPIVALALSRERRQSEGQVWVWYDMDWSSLLLVSSSPIVTCTSLPLEGLCSIPQLKSEGLVLATKGNRMRMSNSLNDRAKSSQLTSSSERTHCRKPVPSLNTTNIRFFPSWKRRRKASTMLLYTTSSFQLCYLAPPLAGWG